MDIVKNIELYNNKDYMINKEKENSQHDKQDEYVMYILVNSDLNMGKGKIANQCSHSACRVVRIIENLKEPLEAYTKWIDNYEPKIVLKATEKELDYIISKYNIFDKQDFNGIWCTYTRDIGRTQIKEGSLTTVAFAPIQRKNVPDEIKSMKLL